MGRGVSVGSARSAPVNEEALGWCRGAMCGADRDESCAKAGPPDRTMVTASSTTRKLRNSAASNGNMIHPRARLYSAGFRNHSRWDTNKAVAPDRDDRIDQVRTSKSLTPAKSWKGF